VLVRAGRTLQAQVGDAIRLSWPDGALHLFDNNSGRRLHPAG
jgi:hypothetical protein